mmetsp:Transcript_65605/g.158185  ORF Transcript_65605/g.158185 Transcript_65605/m.158185 type:complete len:203 (+) Transcript_65605:1194-1802(+)
MYLTVHLAAHNLAAHLAPQIPHLASDLAARLQHLAAQPAAGRGPAAHRRTLWPSLLLWPRRHDGVRWILPVRVHAAGLSAEAAALARRAAEWSSVRNMLRAMAADLELLGRVGDETETACRRRRAVIALRQRRQGYTRWQRVPITLVAGQALQPHASGLHAAGEVDPHPIGQHKRRRQAALSLEGDPHPLVVHVELGRRGDA